MIGFATSYACAIGGIGEAELCIGVAKDGANRQQLIQQPAPQLPRFELVCLRASLPMTVTQALESQIRSRSSDAEGPLDFLTAHHADPFEQGADLKLGAFLGKEHPTRAHLAA